MKVKIKKLQSQTERILAMNDKIKLCMGCMEPLDEHGFCNHCSYNPSLPYLQSYLPPATVLDGRYIAGKLLSYNGESAVYIGYDMVASEKVLIKEYMPDALCTRTKESTEITVNQNSVVQYKNYMSEFIELNKTLSRMRTLSHIVPAVDMFNANNTEYVVLQYVEAITLKQFLQDNAGELSWEQIKKMFPPILTTLSLIHNAGIIHRGISLDTILVTNRGELKLTGFAIAEERMANTDLSPELFVGYTAPEQYSSKEWQGTWTDVYAVAAVLYRLLTGCMPPEAMARVADDNLREPAYINSNVPPNVSKVIMQAMTLSCNSRIQTVTEFVTKLFEQPEYMDKPPRGATQTIPIQRLPQNKAGSERINVAAIVGAAALVVLVAIVLLVLVVMLLPSGERNQPVVTQPPESTSDSLRPATTTTTSATTAPTTASTSETSLTTEPQGTMFEMPNLVGQVLEKVNANTVWTDRIQIEAEFDYNAEYENGVIYEQDIDAGTNLYPVQVVKVKVSLGPETALVPDYLGMSKKDYLDKLTKLNIKYVVETVESTTVQTDYVVRCSKNIGDEINVKDGEILTVYVSVYVSPGNVFPGDPWWGNQNDNMPEFDENGNPIYYG